MNSKAVLETTLMLLLIGRLTLAFNIQTVGAEPVERKVGVNVGDWARYGDIAVSFVSNDPSTPVWIQPYAFDIEWLTAIVQTIIGTEITFQAVIYYKNGTEQTQTLSIDVDTGYGVGVFYFISADLDAGERIYGAPHHPIINETVSRLYAGVAREVNHVNVSGTTGHGDYVLFSSLDAY